uniref:Small nuclear ribonucleoprotein Sm D2 n=1 Tax=Paramoeba aestuarina TaxID=180227 RepID=A0A7S4KRS3_9EUKA|mmetsp:Transcript_23947/g.37301  ORF Transcript_23947/g.37301 Transcript_23947/m.37301 type:complete len:109 (+) Transcript_23947:30-356(+)|eukprot:CAMPEP_0201508498 /NCGR_PEP_ID=MMETSP0161_2-20130828/1855_1 /ASSEMBLY_ACC=CAM_ASM_000251 /TAXON_ID=180227 /ORGANISM="Neoparamoeba aestuarina, Strain SoJaBio B1-5/56/2" /LENGTH=108 /DNA_ID=CAMNT_0047903191 /DNA_START=30 /DNA_END=356 /DNA_ORIENTATION=-
MPTATKRRPEDSEAKELENFVHGPFSVLDSSMRSGDQVLISCRSNKKLVGRIRAFDRHMNMILDNSQEIWMDSSSMGYANRRMLGKVFLRGDNVILVVKNPGKATESD